MKGRGALWLCVFVCVRVCPSSSSLCVCVHTITRSGEETRRLHESLYSMSGMHKNTMKEPETEACRMLPPCMVTLNVLYLWGRATSNKSHKSAESQGDAIIFSLSLMLKVSPKVFCPIRETQDKKRGIRSWISTYEDAVQRSQVFKCVSN